MGNELTDAQKLEAEAAAHLATKAELEQTQLVNADLQGKIEELEVKLQKGAAAKPEKEKVALPSKAFKVKFSAPPKAADPKNQEEDHTGKNGSYVFTMAKLRNPLDNQSEITAEEALTNQPLLDELVKIGFGGIQRK